MLVVPKNDIGKIKFPQLKNGIILIPKKGRIKNREPLHEEGKDLLVVGKGKQTPEKSRLVPTEVSTIP